MIVASSAPKKEEMSMNEQEDATVISSHEYDTMGHPTQTDKWIESEGKEFNGAITSSGGSAPNEQLDLISRIPESPKESNIPSVTASDIGAGKQSLFVI